MLCRVCSLEKEAYARMKICKDCHKQRVMDRYRLKYEKIREQMILYNHFHRDLLRENEKRYYEANKHKWIKKKQGRLGRLVGEFSKEEWLNLCSKYDHKCLSCGKQTKLTVDHVIPISKGGANTIDNIQPLCQSCNSKKGTKVIDYR